MLICAHSTHHLVIQLVFLLYLRPLLSYKMWLSLEAISLLFSALGTVAFAHVHGLYIVYTHIYIFVFLRHICVYVLMIEYLVTFYLGSFGIHLFILY